MKISIITPSFNQGQYIEDAIGSVLAQNYPDVEHIVVDGGSTDDTVERLKKYPHLKWVSEPDEGQSDALNKGFRLATGDVIGWLNCDDFYLPGAFAEVSRTLQEDHIHGVYANILFCNQNGMITGSKKSHRPSRILSLFYSYINSETFFFKRGIIESGILIDKSFHICMDKEFMAHILFKRFKLKFINKPLAVFRWHETNKSLNSPAVKGFRLKEGVKIFNRYNGWIAVSEDKKINQLAYGCMTNLMKPFRFLLKITS